MKLKNYLLMNMIIVCSQKIKKKMKNNHQYRFQKLIKKKKKEGTGLKLLTLNKLLTRISILLAQIKAANNSYKLKN